MDLYRLKAFEYRKPGRTLGHKREEVTEGCKNCIISCFVIVIFMEYYQCDQSKEDEIGETRSVHGQEKCTGNFTRKTEWEETTWEAKS
jgi:ferredoxin